MCRSCIIEHFEKFLDNAREQFLDETRYEVELRLERLNPCRPISSINQNLVHTNRKIRFPGRSKAESQSFTYIIRLCDLILTNLKVNKTSTLRDLFYQDVALFKTQQIVVRAIDQISRHFMIPRELMNVSAGPNGLVAGDLTFAMESGELCEVRRINGPTFIPVGRLLNVFAKTSPEYVLVVEKEAVFSYLHSELREGIVVTGKGFPDRATRNFLSALKVSHPFLPIYGLVDSDPHGILIMRSYECGSSTSVEIQTPLDIKYLGISLLEYPEGLVPLTANDRKVAMSTLRKEWIGEPKYQKYREELQRGLFMNMKGEMNLMDGTKTSSLAAYVREKIEAMPQSCSQLMTPDQSQNSYAPKYENRFSENWHSEFEVSENDDEEEEEEEEIPLFTKQRRLSKR